MSKRLQNTALLNLSAWIHARTIMESVHNTTPESLILNSSYTVICCCVHFPLKPRPLTAGFALPVKRNSSMGASHHRIRLVQYLGYPCLLLTYEELDISEILCGKTVS